MRVLSNFLDQIEVDHFTERVHNFTLDAIFYVLSSRMIHMLEGVTDAKSNALFDGPCYDVVGFHWK